MNYFLLRDNNILPNKEPYSSLWVGYWPSKCRYTAPPNPLRPQKQGFRCNFSWVAGKPSSSSHLQAPAETGSEPHNITHLHVFVTVSNYVCTYMLTFVYIHIYMYSPNNFRYHFEVYLRHLTYSCFRNVGPQYWYSYCGPIQYSTVEDSAWSLNLFHSPFQLIIHTGRSVPKQNPNT